MGSKLSKESFFNACMEKHNCFYSYSSSVYEGLSSKITIECPKHGLFSQKAGNHLNGSRCPKCSSESISRSRQLNSKTFIAKAKEKHGDIYDYSNVSYQGAKEKVVIICKEHGAFSQTAGNHLFGQGCPQCGRLKTSNAHMMDSNDFVDKAILKHGNKYGYENSLYSDSLSGVEISCPEHGLFIQRARDHLDGCGCPICGKKVSKGELEVYSFIKSICPDALSRNRGTIGNKELDIYIPSKKIAVEFNGVYFHSDNFRDKNQHFEKYKLCLDLGIRLIQFTDQDWISRRKQLEALLTNALGLSKATKVDARKCVITKEKYSDIKSFLDENHIQGAAKNPLNYCLRDMTGSLVAVMCFGFGNTGRGKGSLGRCWELSRYATNCTVRGGASRLFKAFIKEQNPHTVKSFSMNDLFSGEVYKTLNFEGQSIPPDYRVFHRKTGLLSKSHWQRRNIQKRLVEIGSEEVYSATTDKRTEREIQDLVGATRVWDSGKTRWVWENNL